MESFPRCPEHTASAPIFFALESARFLRHAIDTVDTASDAEITRLRHEVTMLRHWIQAGEPAASEYSALSQGLADFADGVQQRLSTE